MSVLKIAYNAIEHKFHVESNDRGDWIPVKNPVESAVFELQGYGGENSVVIMVSGMQDTTADVVVAHTMVDSPIQIAHRRVAVDKPSLKKDRTMRGIADAHSLMWIDLGMHVSNAINEMILEVKAC